jgi:hypothetical protein
LPQPSPASSAAHFHLAAQQPTSGPRSSPPPAVSDAGTPRVSVNLPPRFATEPDAESDSTSAPRRRGPARQAERAHLFKEPPCTALSQARAAAAKTLTLELHAAAVSVRVAAGRIPPLPRVRSTSTAGSSSDVPDRATSLVKAAHTGQPYPAPALDLHRPIAILRIRSAPSAYPRVFANKTLSFSRFTTRSSHLIKPLRLSPVFFCFSPKAQNSLRFSPKTCFNHNFVVLAPFSAFFMSTRSSRRVE